MLKAVLSACLLLGVSKISWAEQDAEFDGAAPASLPVSAPMHAQGAPSVKAGGRTVWAAFDPADVGADFPITSPVAQSGSASIYQIDEDKLPAIARFMHEKYHRCGGFFAYRTRAEAEKSLAPALAPAAGGPYTIDQQAWAKPLVARVTEQNLHATIDSLAAYNSRYYTSDSGADAARWLQTRWQALAAKLPGAQAQLFSHDGWKQPSVILTIPGSEKPDEIVVLGGHLDSINLSDWGDGTSRAPGADDNASGIAVLTEAVRILSDAGFKPKRTVQFMGYAAEEVGLRGSQDIAKQYASSGKKVVAVIQYDMTNFKGSGDGLWFLTDNVDPTLTAFLEELADAYIGGPRSTLQCGYACSDHASWTRAGFPAAAAFESTFEAMNHNIHTEDDTMANSGGSADHSVAFAKLAVAFAVETAKTASGFRLAGVDKR